MKIIAYGSLMNKRSLEKTICRPVTVRPMILRGYKRVFSAPFDGFSFLNLQKSRNTRIAVGYFNIAQKELELFSRREAGSRLIEVQNGYFAFVWPRRKCALLPVLASYIKVCETGARQLKINFWGNTVKPQIVFDDLAKPLYK